MMNNQLRLENFLDQLYEIAPEAVRLVDASKDDKTFYTAVELRTLKYQDLFIEFANTFIKFEIDLTDQTVNVSKEIEIAEILDIETESDVDNKTFDQISKDINEMIESDSEKVIEEYKKLIELKGEGE